MYQIVRKARHRSVGIEHQMKSFHHKQILFIWHFFIYLTLFIDFVMGKSCKGDLDENQCSDTQYCDMATNTCICRPGYTAHNETYCKKLAVTTSPPPTTTILPLTTSSALPDGTHHGPLVAAILVPLFFIAFVVGGFFVVRHYRLNAWLRNRFVHRNSNYDEFMIGQDPEDDDPPLR